MNLAVEGSGTTVVNEIYVPYCWENVLYWYLIIDCHAKLVAHLYQLNEEDCHL